MPIQNCTTIQEFIDFGKEQRISHEKMFTKSIIVSNDKCILGNYLSILNRYMDVIRKILIIKEFTQEEMDRYIYKPKLYCMDEFGSIDFWSLILRVNDMVSVTDFKEKKIKTFSKNDLYELINEILILENDTIIKNEDEIENKLIKYNVTT